MSKLRQLGQSEIKLSPLGIGTWQFSNKGGTWDAVSRYHALSYRYQ